MKTEVQEDWKRQLRQLCREYGWTDRLDRARMFRAESKRLNQVGQNKRAGALLHQALVITADLRSDIEELGDTALALKIERRDRSLRTRLEKLDMNLAEALRAQKDSKSEVWKEELEETCLLYGWSHRLSHARNLLQESQKLHEQGDEAEAGSLLREALTITAALRGDIARVGETKLALKMESQDNMLRAKLNRLGTDELITPTLESTESWKDNLRHLCLIHGWTDRLERARKLLREAQSLAAERKRRPAAEKLREALTVTGSLRSDILGLGEMNLWTMMASQDRMLELELEALESGQPESLTQILDLDWKEDLDELCLMKGWTDRLAETRLLLRESSELARAGDKDEAANLLRRALMVTEGLRADVINEGELDLAATMETQNQMLRTHLARLEMETELTGSEAEIFVDTKIEFKCDSCERPIETDWVACPYCKAPLDSVGLCPACEKPVDEDWNSCPWCKQDLS